MVRTQIQLPEELYQDLKRLARRKQWSLAETLRRGAESLLERYPEPAASAVEQWQPPRSSAVGWRGLDAARLRDLARDDEADRQLAH
jgi:hypothetical protein